MNYKVKIIVAILLLVLAANASAPTMIGADLGYKSKYVWRGIPFNTESVFWPDVWINWNEFTFTVFGSVNMTDYLEGYKGKFTEVDLYLVQCPS